MKPIICLFAAIILVTGSKAFAQQGNTQHKNDSLHNAALDSQLARIQRLSAERLADSAKKAQLERQVAQLSTADNIKRLDLLKELNKVKEKDSLRLATQKHRIDSLRKFVKGFPVVPFRDTLFSIYARQGSFTAQERAEAITGRIEKLSTDLSFSADSLKLVSNEITTDIVFRDKLLLSVSEPDALWQNTTRQSLAARCKSSIETAMLRHRNETRWQTILKESLLALLVIVVAILLIYVVNRSLKWLLKNIRNKGHWFTKGIRVKNYEILNAERQIYLLNFIFRIIKWFLFILIVYLTLPVLFGIFPFTHDLSDLLISYVTTPLKRIGISVWNYIPNLVTIMVLVIIFRYVLRFIAYIKDEIEKEELKIPGFYPDWANPTYQIIRVLVLAFLLIVIFPYLPGSDSAVFKGVSVFVGVLFTFGSAGALGNIVSGVVMTYTRAFKLGDRVKIGEVTGDIIEKTLLVTRVRTIQNEIISIPNSTVISNHTVNYSSDATEKGLILHTTVTIGYDAPWRQVHQLLIDAALATPMVEKDPTPYVFQTSLDDYYVSYRINAFTKEPNKQASIYSALHANIQDHFNKAGVEIMSPHYKALRDGNATTIPNDYLPDGYIAPTFKTQQSKEK
ncbi:MAG TPA: mechanosensitive ion channel family protein [Mucilaginibacter sp.]|jgi:small-conductance mechanosensitive channel|nr:mechanosensitive ion channel family protein [Mucilaginibacter sp.]